MIQVILFKSANNTDMLRHNKENMVKKYSK